MDHYNFSLCDIVIRDWYKTLDVMRNNVDVAVEAARRAPKIMLIILSRYYGPKYRERILAINILRFADRNYGCPSQNCCKVYNTDLTHLI